MAEVLHPTIVATNVNYYLTPAKGGDATWYPGTASNFTRTHDVVKHTSEEKEFADAEQLKKSYYAETAELLKRVTGATHVHPLSHIVRRTGWKDAVEKAKGVDPLKVLPGGASGQYCHVGEYRPIQADFGHLANGQDQSYEGATQVISDNLPPEEFAKLTKTRYGIFNVWRPAEFYRIIETMSQTPQRNARTQTRVAESMSNASQINQTIRREPLAMCDARSVDDSDLHPIQLQFIRQESYKAITKGDSYEAWGLAPNDKHKWYYASGLTPDEVVIFKNFDSKLDGRARRCPHTSFSSDNDSGPPRESIELRCFVFWEDQEKE